MSEYAVELREVSKHFGPVAAVDGISLSIRDGEFFSLLGPSGCGKTTTLRLIAGFELLTAGKVYIGGRLQGETPPYRRPVNTVFQNYALFPHMSVFGNVAFGLEMQKVRKEEIRWRVLETLELVQLPGMENRKPDQLSGGQQQWVALMSKYVPPISEFLAPPKNQPPDWTKEIVTEVRGTKDSREVTYRLGTLTCKGALPTGVAPARTAIWLAEGRIPPGVHPPEAVIEPEPFFKELEERRIYTQVSVTRFV
jgi:ABC-type sugar transport system ATPase subunit